MARREAGMSIEKGRIATKFDYEIRFRKDTGVFFVEVPPGEKLQADSLEGIRQLIREYARDYRLPGAWVKKLFIHSRAVDDNHWHNGFSKEVSGLEVSWFVFEEREVSPVGQRICRKWDAKVKPEDDDFASRRGSDEEFLLRAGHTVLWTQEREDMLRALRQALTALHAKLEGALKVPELLPDVVKLLLPAAAAPSDVKCHICEKSTPPPDRGVYLAHSNGGAYSTAPAHSACVQAALDAELPVGRWNEDPGWYVDGALP